MPTLRALECLVAASDLGSITQAAQHLHLSQPAVSHHLAALEREARTPLILREARGVRLTPAGRAALADARRAVDAAESALQIARAAGTADGGALRIACAQSLTVALLAPVIRDWHRRYPGVAITLRESTRPEEMFDFVDKGEVDLLLVPGPAPDRYTATAVGEEEVVLTLPRDHRLARKPQVSLVDLDGIALVHFSPDNGLGAWLDRSLVAAGARPTAVMRTSVTSFAPQLAASGLGVAVTPISAVGTGLPGAVRSFSPRWTRQLVAVSSGGPDPLSARFVSSLRTRGVRVPKDIRDQLAAH